MSNLKTYQKNNRGLKGLLVQGLALLTLLLTTLPAMGQAVIMNGNYFLTHNETGTAVNAAATNTFNPNTCLWYVNNRYIQTANSSGEAYEGNYYLQRTSLSLGGASRWTQASNGNTVYYSTGGWGATYYYLRRNNTTWQINNTNSNNGTVYNVTISTVESSSTNPTISGADVLTATGNSTYTASGAAYRIGYTNYRFNNADHYVDANGNSFTGTPANATIGTYSWSLTDNAYATVNNTSGVVTVASLPEYDIVLTLTVTATATGGNPAAPAGTTLTATKEITIQGTKPSAPTITVNGTNVTLATDAVGSTTIRYTLDGTNPTASTGTVYSGAIDLSGSATSPVTIKAVTVRNGNASDVSSEVVTLTLPEPTITINGEAQTATITSSIAGATIYYTTDGTTPTTSSSQYTGTLTGLDYMTTIKAIAVKDGWNNSPVASGIVTIPSGVGGGVVTLFDYEPHSWSYYSDPDCPIRSLSPADVKITYYGDGIVMTGNDDYTASSTDFVQPGQTNYTGGAKVNVGGEDENTFIYYKTLERGANTQTAWTYSTDHSSAASRCPYTTIPNPFQVRPTYGARGSIDANNFTGWRGFQCWRLKSVSGGSVYSAASGGTALTAGAVINGETEIYFAPNSEYGMEVELEAVWARAYLIKGNQGGANTILSQNVGVERNFMTLTTNENYRFNGTDGRRITNIGYPVTISCYYPSGEAPDNTNGVVTGNNNNITLGADTKFENVTLSAAAYTLTASGYNLIVGRGCSGSTVNIVRGMGEGSNTTLNYTIRLESGVYNYVSFTAGYYNNNDGNNGSNYTFSGANNKVKGVMGSDYDRAKEGPSYNYANAPLRVTYNMIVGATPTFSNQNETEFFNTTIKSGYYGSGFNGLGSGSAANSFYLGVANTFNTGKRKLTIEGGKLNLSLAGGIDEDNTSDDALTIRMKGGTVAGSVYGAAAFSSATGGRRFIFTGGTVGGWIAGGANGTQTTGGKLDGKTFIYFGGTAQCNSNGSATTIGPGNATGGNIFGAGSGNASASATATVGEVDQSTIVIADECMVERNVYGGGNYGYVAGTAATNKSDIYISGGNVVGSVFGGANMQKGNIVNITMKGGLVNEGVYGGSNTRGTISGNITIQVDGGTVGDGTDGDGIFGGGYGANTAVNGNVSVTLGASTSATDSATVNGNVYGGSALGDVNDNANDNTTVTMNKALVNGNLFGGAFGNGAAVTGRITVTVNGGRVNGSVFGGGDAAAYSHGGNFPVVNMTGGTVTNVFGGGKGNTAIVTGNPQVTLSGNAHVTDNVYGGGDAAQVSGSTNVKVQD